MKNRCESEKRRLFAVVADHFPQFCGVAHTLDERGFREALLGVKQAFSELVEMEAAIRRIVGAAPNQSVREAVEQIVTAVS
jgi:hypothetical protein